MNIDELFEQAARALEAEIETVRERPSTDLLLGGKKVSRSEVSEGADYRFETSQPSIRFAEEIKARAGEKEWLLHPVSFEKNEIILRFPEEDGETIEELHVEWENDFVLQKTLQEVDRLAGGSDALKERIRRLFKPGSDQIPGSVEAVDDKQRNVGQFSAIEKALKYRTVYIWGPPGTGKTATLGFIIANYLMQGKSVLFASNTNRAVDVGLLKTLQALDAVEASDLKEHATRFGEAVLDEEDIQEVTFEHQVDKIRRERQEIASEWIGWLERKKEIMESVEKRLRDGKQPSAKQNMELELIDQKITDAGGREQVEEKIEELRYVNERTELRKKQLVATTLAKVCTSEMFYDLDFDAVVVDEGSMANLPYLMVLAAKAQWHCVIVGDPMQLPPIALTDHPEARQFLEKDIFTTVSGAEKTEELFAWHDANAEITAFFNTQYRLKPSLADVISTVFYEGRLKTEKLDAYDPDSNSRIPDDEDRAYHLIDTSKYQPFLEQKSGDRGFQPVNVVHQQILERLIRKMLNRGIAPADIGVMLPFRSPVYDLRNHFYQNGIQGIEVGTIHTFQGREKPYIIFDTVMSGEVQGNSVRHYSVRPLDEEKNGLSVPRLLNVAFSRSQKELLILADMKHVNRVYGNKFLGRLLERMK